MNGRAARPERRFRPFVVTAMQSPFTLPVLGGSLLAAIAFGLHLGESSIGLINPIFFEAPPLHPRDRGAAIDESRLHRTGPVYADLYGWEQGHAMRAADCGNCEAVRARDAYAYSAAVPYFGTRADLRTAVVEASETLGEEFAEVPQDLSPRQASLDRYAHYPLTEEAAEIDIELKEPPGEIKEELPE